MSEEILAQFLKDNKTTINYAERIDKYLCGYKLISMIPLVNSCCMGLKLDKNTEMLNSNMLIDYAGGGKSTLLKIFTQSNPKLFLKLDAKMYAYEIAKDMSENIKNYQNKILVHDDLIGMFQGLSQKSKEQLTFFWTYLLSEGKYAQLGFKIENLKVMTMFGCARDVFKRYRSEFFVSTLGERITMYDAGTTTDAESIKAIEMMKHNKKNDIPLPKIKLPVTRTKKKIEWFDDDEKEISKEINNLCIEMKQAKVKSPTRAYNYISNFLMSNALLNGRNKVTANDLILYKMVHPFHLYKISSRNQSQTLIRDNLLKPKKEQSTDLELMKQLQIPSSTYYNLKSKVIAKFSYN